MISITTASSDPVNLGKNCVNWEDCGDTTTMCCGIASGGRIVRNDNTITERGVPNQTMCNFIKDPENQLVTLGEDEDDGEDST